MSRVLGIETATRICSTAIVEDGSRIGEISLSVPHVHVEKLVLMINQLLDDLHLKYEDLDGIAVSNGPGSFTGVRIGLSVGKGIAFAHSRNLIAVPTLDALAHQAMRFVDSATTIPLLHARGEEFYYSAFSFPEKKMKRLKEFTISESSAIADEFDPGVLFVGEGVNSFSKFDSVRLKFGTGAFMDISASASDVALIGSEKLAAGEVADVRTLVPLYIKDFVALKRTKVPTY